MTDKPVIAYNIPSRVVVNIEPATMDDLAQIENVAGVKQAYGDLEQARHIVDIGLTLYAGDDNLVFPFLEIGGEGGVCVHTHVWGRQTKEMVRRYKSGDVAGAKTLNDEMAPAFELLKIQTNPIPIKAAVNLLGHEVGGYRLPMVDPTEDELTQVRSCLERAGMLEAARA
jgi:4-hydroxy-tetrahydrodipicolinate synthase